MASPADSKQPPCIALADTPLETALDRTLEVLEAGGLVAVPTETVYGLVARIADPAVVQRVYDLKERPLNKALPHFVGAPEQLEIFTSDPPPRALRLMDAFWPGPLTIVMGREPGVGLRMPDHPFARELARRAAGPLVATSANLSGDPEAKTAQEAIASLGSGLDLVVDDGPVRGGQASSVVRVGPLGQLEMLREGPLSGSALARAAPLHIAFVCTGNTCRSPMAEALARHLAADLVSAGVLRFSSAGLAAADGAPASRGALEAMAARPELGSGVLESHTSTPYSRLALEDRPDIVFPMTPSHAGELRRRGAPVAALVAPGEAVDDPFGQPVEVYERTAEQLEAAIRTLLPSWALAAIGPQSLGSP